MRRELNKILFVLGISFLFVQCRTVKILPERFKGSVRNTEVMKVYEKRTKQVESVVVTFGASYDDGDNKRNFKGYIKIRKDSCIIVSISPGLGIELFRISVTKDTIVYLNRLDKEYGIKNFSFLENWVHIPVTYDEIENILLANILITDFKDQLSNGKTSIKERVIPIKSERTSKDKILYKTYDLFPANYLIKSNENVLLPDNKKFIVGYDRYMKSGDYLYPKEMSFYFLEGDKHKSLMLQIKKWEINAKTNFAFNIPKKYKRI